MHKQQKLIVYNVPQHVAIDFINGNSFCFSGDFLVITDTLLKNFNLKPSRVKDRISIKENVLLPHYDNMVLDYSDKKILLLNHALSYLKSSTIPVDIIIVCGKISNSMRQLNDVFDCKTYIASSNIAMWKLAQWKKDCEQLHLRFHSVAQQGAFTIKM